MKIALVHDRLCAIAGSERVFQYICAGFPQADIYTLTYDRTATLPYFASRPVRTTWLDPFVRSTRLFKVAFPLATRVMERIKLKGYDVVLSSSATVAKYVNVQDGVHLCYCYIPTRALWQPDEYFGANRLGARIFRPIVSYLKKHDHAVAQRIDQFLTLSETSRSYIRQFYQRDADVIPCPVDLSLFHSSPKSDYYLIVSRLEYWKRVDYAVEAFNRLGLRLRIVGTGTEERRLRAAAKSNITFVGAISDADLAREYSMARAVVFTPCLEFGLTPLEANASGTPVICFGEGGVCETMIPVGSKGNDKPTAVFFYQQSAEALIGAIEQFQTCDFGASDLIRHASRWSVPRFQERLQDAVNNAARGIASGYPVSSAAFA